MEDRYRGTTNNTHNQYSKPLPCDTDLNQPKKQTAPDQQLATLQQQVHSRFVTPTAECSNSVMFNKIPPPNISK
ncbi:hypothetical protein HYC85_017961 [Camellia sinensis]|uniref:Uncharacterized protein n=1 Tax=Camellia sinensis TaxID=4442 RepID=A0A7J7GWM1_CAMSI|nr:hypothetical protein HYC85_017961 [Camellia sinensis]